jgi:colicin import membrane protein
MAAVWREHVPSVLFSVLLHGLLVLAVVFATHFSWTHASLDLHPLPVSATVVDSKILQAAERAQRDAAAQAQAEARAAAQAKLAAEALANQAAADAAADAAAEARAAEARAAEARAAEARAAEDAKRADTAKSALDRKRAADAKQAADLRAALAARQAVAAKQAVEARQALAAKQALEAKQAADAKRAADAKVRADREAELRRQLEDEEHASAVEAGPLGDRYRASLQNRITHAWIKPPSARSGIDCRVEVTQVPGGEVTNARVTQCNGDAAVRQSIENAVYRASPLPDPPDPSLFHRVFVLEFKPND